MTGDSFDALDSDPFVSLRSTYPSESIFCGKRERDEEETIQETILFSPLILVTASTISVKAVLFR